jgi:deoxyribodipyrimidine photo-lyase
MQRDQRVEDNWALVYAQQEALRRQVPLMVVFNLVPVFGQTTLRHYDFMFGGLREVEQTLRSLQIPFVVLEGEPTTTIPSFVASHRVGEVVTDFNPLRFTNEWRERVGEMLAVALTEVDAHNIVPCWYASPKQEFAAYTFRPKVTRALREFAGAIPPIVKHSYTTSQAYPHIDWDVLLATRVTNRSIRPVTWLTPGTTAGLDRLELFLTEGIGYHERRNDPTLNALSHLSPYFHFGQIAPQRAAFACSRSDLPQADRDAFLEELIVRRELADNYCFYNSRYDQVEGAHAWAQTTLAEHAGDVRDYVYTRDEFEYARTHDPLWNAAQYELISTGKMHGFMRMYWAKKILEWTPDPQTAISIALYLNDTYELDGTDPNGVVGVMWSICGVHDRAWNERPIFGKVRYMNDKGCKRKFDVSLYIETHTPPQGLFV